MFRKIKRKDELDVEKLNDIIDFSNKILKIVYILIIMLGLFLAIRLCQALNLKTIIISFFKILEPLFIGIFLAWLFAPLVHKLNKKGIRRSLGTAIVYFVFIGLLLLLICSIIPILSDQINDFVKTLPSIFDSIKIWINDFFDKLGTIDGFDAESVKSNIFEKIEVYGGDLATSLPEIMVNFARTLFSGLGVFVVGLIIGFYLSVGFDNASDLIVTLFPKNIQKNVRELGNKIEYSLRKFINGAILDSLLIFIIISIAFFAIGLKAPLVFGLFCSITNIIPYAGPYIGGVPAVIVGFSQGPITGILTLIAIIVIQFLEGNFLQPFIMSKTTKLHPVTIIVGLLIFGHFFGIIGMVISTPLIAVMKAVLLFLDEKLEISLFISE